MTVQWGILSTARINDKFLAGVARSQAVTVRAVASRDRDHARRYADERGIDRAYGSYEELLADPDLEALYISLPNAMHLPWTERALRAGKHVLCEKPLGRRAAEVQAVFDLARRRGLGAQRGVHVPPSSPDPPARRAGRIRSGRHPADDPGRVQLRDRRRRQRQAAERAGGRGADGRRLLLRQRRAAARRRARARDRAATPWRRRRRRRVRRDDGLCRRRAGPLRCRLRAGRP